MLTPSKNILPEIESAINRLAGFAIPRLLPFLRIFDPEENILSGITAYFMFVQQRGDQRYGQNTDFNRIFSELSKSGWGLVIKLAHVK